MPKTCQLVLFSATFPENVWYSLGLVIINFIGNLLFDLLQMQIQ